MIKLILIVIVIVFVIWMLRRGFRALEHWQETRAAVKVHTVVRPRAAVQTRNRIKAETESAHRLIDYEWGRLYDRTKNKDEKVLRKILNRTARGESTDALVGKRSKLQTSLKAISQSAKEAHATYEKTVKTRRIDQKTGEVKHGIRKG